LYNKRNLENYLPNIIYQECVGFNPALVKAFEYFGEEGINNEEKKRLSKALPTEFKNENEKDTDREQNEEKKRLSKTLPNEIKNENEKETDRELKDENNNGEGRVVTLQLKENINTDNKEENSVKVNNFTGDENDTNIQKETKNIPQLKTQLVTFKDYKLLKPEQLFYDRRTFLQGLKDLLIKKHQIISLLFQRSLFEPCFLRYIKLLFELNLQFALCAMLFTDSYIEKRLTRQITVNPLILN
jgi:hypothetical protein